MNDLEIAKRIAEIEGIEIETYTNINGDLASVHEPQDENGWSNVYNPFDWSILGPLMVKYKVEIDFDIGVVGVLLDNSNRYLSIDFSSEKEIPISILECIIKSQEQ